MTYYTNQHGLLVEESVFVRTQGYFTNCVIKGLSSNLTK